MTQGYGPDHGQQGQWGQGGQNPPPPSPWGQQTEQPAPAAPPQWGQPSPAPQSGSPMASPSPATWGQAPPAAPSAVQTAPTRLMKWLYYGAIAVVAARGLYLLCNIITSVFIVGLAGTATDPDGIMAGVGIGMFLLLLGLVGVVLLSAGLLVLAIIVAVKAAGRGRTGAIIIGAAVLLSFGAYLATRGTFLALQGGAASDFDALMTMAIVEYGVSGLHWLVFAAAVIVGAVMSRRWARENA